ncbi:MAG: thioredoxin domain-containing protein [Candidatus Zambryskibacteria bacterium]|nr:thioredoxin domain-containing protein [Candidatus Zambryskibacteria bacterium]
MEKQIQNPYMVPAAIVVAGLLVAGAVVYNGGSGGVNLAGNGGANNVAPAEGGLLATPAQAAEAVGLDKSDFEKCVSEERGADKVSSNLQEGLDAGIGGTPTSVLVTASGKQYFMVGALPVDLLNAYIDAAIEDDTAALTELNTQYGIPDANNVPALGDGDHVRGSVDAPVTLIEYSDLECPFCKSFHPQVQQALAGYGNQLSWVYRHFPLDFHPSARPLAEGSECAAQLGGNDKFWEYVDYVFSS